MAVLEPFGSEAWIVGLEANAIPVRLDRGRQPLCRGSHELHQRAQPGLLEAVRGLQLEAEWRYAEELHY